MSRVYPWFEDLYEKLHLLKDSGKLGHAYLMLGNEGLGKLPFCNFLAKSLLCPINDQKATREETCHCLSCGIFQSGNPDFLLVEPREDGKQITVDQIRGLSRFFSLKSHYEGQKICVICPAEVMNANASNALLKILEEPPKNALIILTAHSIGLIAPTVRSRCQIMKIPEPSEDEIMSLLSEDERKSLSLERANITYYGGPCIAQGQFSFSFKNLDSLIEDLHALAIGKKCPVASAKNYSDWKVPEFFNSLELLSRHLILMSYGHELKKLHLSTSAKKILSELSNAVPSRVVFDMISHINIQQNLFKRTSGVRFVDAIETIFVHWVPKARKI